MAEYMEQLTASTAEKFKIGISTVKAELMKDNEEPLNMDSNM